VPTIQAGVDSAAPGDTVLVAPGTYTRVEASERRNFVNFRGRDVVVRSEAGAAATIIDVNASPSDPYRGFFIGTQEGPGAVLDGFTIVNGYMGLLPGLVTEPDPKARLPRPRHDLSAGGVKCQDSSPTIRNLVIENCGSEYTGGGMSVELLASPSIVNCVFRSCQANFGGGLSIETASSPTVTDCVLTGNRANRGAGVYLAAGGTLEGCVIAGNTAIEFGGGIMANFPSTAEVRRTIVWGNCGEDGGGEIYIDLDTNLDFGCSVIDSLGIVRAGIGSTVTYSGANVFSAPHFCFPLPCTTAPVRGGDYRVQAASPCLAAASPCGERIGPLDQGCPSQTLLVPTSWTKVKAGYR
jgi:hypothetical protein